MENTCEWKKTNESTLFALAKALGAPRVLHMKKAWISPALEISNLIGQMRQNQSEAIWILEIYLVIIFRCWRM